MEQIFIYERGAEHEKSNLITGIVYVLFGMACLSVALLSETKLESILYGLAGAGTFPGIAMICKYFYLLPRTKSDTKSVWKMSKLNCMMN